MKSIALILIAVATSACSEEPKLNTEKAPAPVEVPAKVDTAAAIKAADKAYQKRSNKATASTIEAAEATAESVTGFFRRAAAKMEPTLKTAKEAAEKEIPTIIENQAEVVETQQKALRGLLGALKRVSDETLK
jgi:hypothetical protein